MTIPAIALPDSARFSPTLTRFAPAPTGLLHLGHVVNAIYVWGLARRLGARVILRIEDHDRQRSRPDFEASLLDDLDWLSFRPDVFTTDAFRAGACESRQSDRGDLYATVARALMTRGLVYACDCSRQEIRATGGAGYSGTCRDRGLPLKDGLAWRVRLESPETATWDDLLLGHVDRSDITSAGDPVIRDRHGNWTYQFAVVVDDHDQQVDLVIRGLDLAESTPLQLRLAALIGRPNPPVFAHHALIMRTATEKLSKSDHATGIAALRTAGWNAADVIGHAAAQIGLVPRATAVPAEEVADLFRSTHARRVEGDERC